MDFLYKSRNAVVVYKPSGMPSQSDPTGSPDAMTLASEALKAAGEAQELWLIHRLDRCVSGLLVFARNKRAAAILSESVRERLLTKEYLAVVSGSAQSGELCDYLYKDARAGKAYVTDRPRSGVKEARLTATVLAQCEGKSLLHIRLDTGRFHQIRAQLSSRKNPIIGDKKYGSKESLRGGIALAAHHLALDIDGEHIDITRLPDTDEYPWSLFPQIKEVSVKITST